MQFLSPWFFAAFAALAVPVIIHLLNLRRPQTLQFSTVAFFKVLQQSTIRRIKIKRWILLALRMVAVALMVFALLRPFMPSGVGSMAASNQPKLYLILADNSQSMAQIDVNGPYINQLKDFLITLVGNAGPRDQFILAPSNGEWQVRGRLDAGSFREAVEALEPVAKGNYMGERLTELIDASVEPGEHLPVLFVISDGQRTQLEQISSRNAQLRDGREPLEVQFIRVGEQATRNVGITDVRILNRILGTNRPVLVETEVTNFNADPISNMFLTLESDGRQGGQYTVNLEPGETRSFVFEVRPDRAGYITGRVYMEGDDFTADDEQYFSISIPATMPMLYVRDADNRPSELRSYLLPVLRAAEETSGRIEVVEARPDQLPDLSRFQAIIFDGLRTLPEASIADIQAFVQDGRSLIVLPSEAGNQTSYNKVLQLFGAPTFTGIRGEYASYQSVAKLGRLSRDHPVLEDLFELRENEDIRVEVPDLYYYWVMDASSSDRSRVLFESNLSEPLIIEQPYGSGIVLLSAFGADPGWSNLPARPLFAPLYYRMVLYAAARDIRNVSGVVLGAGLDLTERIVSRDVDAELNGVVYKPEIRQTRGGLNLRYPGQEWTPGIVNITAGDDVISLAVNLPADESILVTAPTSDISAFFEGDVKLGQELQLNAQLDPDYSNFLQSAGMGREVWHLFLVVGIILLMVETFISRWYKAENV
jgi:hypothetical protein